MASIRVRNSCQSVFTMLQFRASFGLAEDVGHPDLVSSPWYSFFGTRAGRYGATWTSYLLGPGVGGYSYFRSFVVRPQIPIISSAAYHQPYFLLANVPGSLIMKTERR